MRISDWSSDVCSSDLEAILHRTELGAQLRIFGAQKLDPLHLLIAVLGIDGLTPSAVERVAVLDAEPGGEHPACDTDDAHEGDYRSEISEWEHLESPVSLARGSARRSSISAPRSEPLSVAMRSRQHGSAACRGRGCE